VDNRLTPHRGGEGLYRQVSFVVNERSPLNPPHRCVHGADQADFEVTSALQVLT